MLEIRHSITNDVPSKTTRAMGSWLLWVSKIKSVGKCFTSNYPLFFICNNIFKQVFFDNFVHLL